MRFGVVGIILFKTDIYEYSNNKLTLQYVVYTIIAGYSCFFFSFSLYGMGIILFLQKMLFVYYHISPSNTRGTGLEMTLHIKT